MIIRLIEPSKSSVFCEPYPSVSKLSLKASVGEVLTRVSPKSSLNEIMSKVTTLMRFSKTIIAFAGRVTLYIGRWTIIWRELIEDHTCCSEP